jgi:hypothetical protein
VSGYYGGGGPGGHGGGTNLVDILDRVLDKGLVVAGDIKISLANVELLTIRIRLLVCSIDKAEQIGLNWWRYDQSLVRTEPAEPPAALPDAATVARLEARIAELESQLARQGPTGEPGGAPGAPGRSATKSARARSQARTQGGGAK